MTIQQSSTVPAAGFHFDRRLAISLRAAENAPELATRPLRPGELVDLRAEFWRDGFLRQGLPDVPLEDVSLEVTSLWENAASSRCTGFVVEAHGPGREPLRREYGIHLFNDAASLLAQELILAGRLQTTDTYFWQISADTAPAEPKGPAPSFSLSTSSLPLAYVTHALAALAEQAEVIGSIVPQTMPVFYLRRAHERAEKFARLGADQIPAVETGCALLGTLVACPQSGEFYAVVTDALELADTQQKELSLTYTGTTWVRLRAILRARQAQPGGQSLRLLGQAHGHNFLPAGGAPPCELCLQTKVCGRTSVWVSTDDRIWTRAVMASQPWGLCHIFGFNARKEPVSQLYALRDNRLQPHGYYLIDDFVPQSS